MKGQQITCSKTVHSRCSVCHGRGQCEFDYSWIDYAGRYRTVNSIFIKCPHCNGTGVVAEMIPFEKKSRKLTDSTGDPPPLPAGNSAVETTFQQWMDYHTCDGCPTYEAYNGNPFGEKCAICVRAGQVTDNYGSER